MLNDRGGWPPSKERLPTGSGIFSSHGRFLKPTFHLSVGSPSAGWDSLAERVQCTEAGHPRARDRTTIQEPLHDRCYLSRRGGRGQWLPTSNAAGFTIPRNQNHPVLLRSAVKLVGSRRPVDKVGETHSVLPGLSIGDRACAVRRGSAQPTVHKFTASARHGIRRPVPSLSSIDRGRPPSVCASRAPDADVADYTSRRTRQGCASVRCRWRLGGDRPTRASRSTTSARQRCCRGSARVRPC